VVEVQAFSADALAWVTAAPAHRVWGWLRPVAKPEGELFPGLVTIGLAGLATVAYILRLRRAAPAERSRLRRAAIRGLCAAALVALGFTLLVEATGDAYWRVAGVRLTMREPLRGYLAFAVLALTAFALSARARHFARGESGSLIGFFAASAAAAALVALGPRLEVGGAATGVPMPYSLLYYHVPGFDGLRVPARMAMVAYLFLGVLAGYGLAALDRLRHAPMIMAAVGAVFLLEATGAPIAVGHTTGDDGVATPPMAVQPAGSAPAVYTYLATLPPTTVIAELPFGFTSWELRYVYYSAVHRQRLLNGYSGGFPDVYHRYVGALGRPLARPELAWKTLIEAGTTHVVLHRDGFLRGEDAPVAAWLTREGARRLRSFGSDDLYELPR
jgi:hypothetical protein